MKNEITAAATQFLELYRDELKEIEANRDRILNTAHEWWVATRDQYSDDVDYEAIEAAILEQY